MKYIQIQEHNPMTFQEKKEIITILEQGGIFVFPTDSVYSLGCLMSNKKGIQRILKITGKPEKKSNLSLFFPDLKTLADYTQNYNNSIFRAVKNLAPGPYTFIFNASKLVTKKFENSKKEVGVRIPSHKILMEIISELNEPIISTSLNSGDMQQWSEDPYELSQEFQHDVDLVLDNGPSEGGVTTVLDCTGEEIELVRQGIGIVN